MPDRIDIEATLDAAVAAQEVGDLDRAEALCRTIIGTVPDHAEALNILGVIMQDRGQVHESIALLSRAADIDPDFPDAFVNLARGLRFTGMEERAAAAARRATELDPDLGEAWRQLGFVLVSLKQYGEAVVALREAIARMPDAIDLHVQLGLAAHCLKDHETAANAWREVLRLRPDRTDARVNLGVALTELNQLDEAISLLRQASERTPDDTNALTALAHALHRRYDGVELASVCRRLLADDPGRLDILALFASALIWLGQFGELKNACDALLAEQPDKLWFVKQIGAIVPDNMDRDEMDLCRAELNDASLPELRRIAAGYALARALDRAMDYDAAFDAFRTTNALIHATDKSANAGFDRAELRAYVDSTCRMFPAFFFPAFRPAGNPSDLPVFVVGMMRSGTSLVEQIAASHPRVFGAGERPDAVNLVTRLNRGPAFVSPSRWDRDQLQHEAANHVTLLRTLGGDVDRVIDKLPANIQILGQIRALFPNARIIICRRDLRDVCFSCFTTHFGERIPWSHDLEDCAMRTMEIERLTRHWLSVLPGPVLEVNYETLVGDLEAESRRLVDFLGLAWDAACLEFHKTERPVTTASAWQVRQPLYDSSIGRWRRYRSHLGPMLRILARYVPDEPDDPVHPVG
jgi:tetratricopeptide (TPR) repeat protein